MCSCGCTYVLMLTRMCVYHACGRPEVNLSGIVLLGVGNEEGLSLP